MDMDEEATFLSVSLFTFNTASSSASLTGSLVASARMFALICFRTAGRVGTKSWQLRRNLQTTKELLSTTICEVVGRIHFLLFTPKILLVYYNCYNILFMYLDAIKCSYLCFLLEQLLLLKNWRFYTVLKIPGIS
jgi:hypothetical protein